MFSNSTLFTQKLPDKKPSPMDEITQRLENFPQLMDKIIALQGLGSLIRPLQITDKNHDDIEKTLDELSEVFYGLKGEQYFQAFDFLAQKNNPTFESIDTFLCTLIITKKHLLGLHEGIIADQAHDIRNSVMNKPRSMPSHLMHHN